MIRRILAIATLTFASISASAQTFTFVGMKADRSLAWSEVDQEVRSYPDAVVPTFDLMLSPEDYRALATQLPEGFKVLHMGRNNSFEMITGSIDGRSITLTRHDMNYTRMNVSYGKTVTINKRVHNLDCLRWAGSAGWVPLNFADQE